MGTDELHVDDLQVVGYGDDQSVVIALDIEYDAAVFQYAGTSVLLLDIRFCLAGE